MTTARKNMVEGLKKILPYAEEKKVTLCLEMLNSRVDRGDEGPPRLLVRPHRQCAVDICKAIGSERMKILFDIYHVQIMQGDVIRRIRQCQEYIGHYHTAGNPGRGRTRRHAGNQLPPIMRAIAETGYTGFVGQEFIPRAADKVAALATRCDSVTCEAKPRPFSTPSCARTHHIGRKVLKHARLDYRGRSSPQFT